MGMSMKQQHTMSTTWRTLRHWRYTVDPGAVSSSTICATLFSTCMMHKSATIANVKTHAQPTEKTNATYIKLSYIRTYKHKDVLYTLHQRRPKQHSGRFSHKRKQPYGPVETLSAHHRGEVRETTATEKNNRRRFPGDVEIYMYVNTQVRGTPARESKQYGSERFTGINSSQKHGHCSI